MSKPIFYLKDAMLSFGVKPLFDNLSLVLYNRDRVCLVGRNGEGKSSLFKVIAGIYEVDAGQKWALPGIKVSYLPQAIESETDMQQTVGEFVLQGLDNPQDEHHQYLVDIVLAPLKLDKNQALIYLSGGMLRRALLAKTLISEPDILLLDEPTNHLDIEVIEWLEGYLNSYKGAIICISHDRSFLRNISNKTFWLDRGSIRSNDKGYEHFEEWSLQILEWEQKELQRLGKKLELEEQWKIQGVSGRRKRNQKRLGDLFALREKIRKGKAQRNVLLNKIHLDPLTPELSSKMVAEFKNVSKEYEGKYVVKELSMRIMRGDKIGIIGANGTGKTSFLRLLVGDEQPDSGRVRLGKTVEFTYYDQKRTQFDPDDTLWETLCDEGGDHIKVGQRMMHVVGYLKNFLFDPKQARDKVSTLSGGQLNRLLLAKALASPGSLLILDEPTNDLDMDTLDMIKDILYDYAGTLIIVSHDRDFLDSLTTKLLYFSGHGQVEEFIGSCNELKIAHQKVMLATKKLVDKSPINSSAKAVSKLTYKVQYELDNLPDKIALLEQQISELEVLLDAELYTNHPDEFADKAKTLEEAKAELHQAWDRWNELEAKNS